VIEPPDLKLLDSAAKDALILALIERVNDLIAENAKLKERLARLEAKLGEPPKTPSNSSLPPSQGRKASGEASSLQNGKPHKGTNRELHPNPTRTLDVRAKECSSCGGDVSGVEQSALDRYDRIELPEIKPDVTRVVLHGGTCPCCSARFKAAPPPGFEPGSPFGPNLRAFAIYLRVANAVSFERLSQLMSDLVGLKISEGALVNMLAASQPAFARAAALIRAKLLSGTILQSDETGMRVGKQNWWAWVFHHDRECCFSIRPSRGKDVVEAFLGEHRPTSGSPTAWPLRWAGPRRTTRSASLISSAMRTMPSRWATTPSPPPCASYSSALAPSPAGVPASPTPRCALTPKDSTLSWTRSCA
jgi:transposase